MKRINGVRTIAKELRNMQNYLGCNEHENMVFNSTISKLYSQGKEISNLKKELLHYKNKYNFLSRLNKKGKCITELELEEYLDELETAYNKLAKTNRSVVSSELTTAICVVNDLKKRLK